MDQLAIQHKVDTLEKIFPGISSNDIFRSLVPSFVVLTWFPELRPDTRASRIEDLEYGIQSAIDELKDMEWPDVSLDSVIYDLERLMP